MLARTGRRVGDFTADWGAPILLGLTTAAVLWTIWYLTKSPCTAVAAANGLCNPGIVARFINVEILLQSGGAALAVAALKGGYDKFMMRRMLNEEREARQQAEEQLAAERKRVDETVQMVAELVNEFREERRAERQLAAEERQMAAEERQMAAEERQLAAEGRQRDAAIQQALLDTIVRLTQQRNGNGHSENSDA